MKRASRGTTLFASRNDRALQVSKKLAGNAPRAGDVLNDGPLTVPGIYSIDVSKRARRRSSASITATTPSAPIFS